MNPIKVPIKIHPNGMDLSLPEYATEGSAGVDLRAAVEGELLLKPGATAAIPTGISIALPAGFEGQVRPRSGLALRHGIGMLNAPGTIDCDYRGEIRVILTNFAQDPYRLKHGDRIAQLVIARFERIEWMAVSALPDSVRGTGGFGHSGS